MHFEGFSSERIATGDVSIHARAWRHPDPAAPALLLLHGFPQSHYLWRHVAPTLAQDFSLVCADLRGYGDSDKPAGTGDHANYSKRVMAADMVKVMQHYGHERFAILAHDRGARVAHRLALDHAERVTRMVLLDIAPTLTMYEATDMAFARAYFHWFFLIQPHPVPEMMMQGCAPELLRTFLGRWGASLDDVDADAVAEYQRTWATPAGLHASCEDYRASAGIDLEHDRESDARGAAVECPLLVLWGSNGIVGRLFKPLEAWRAKCRAEVSGQAVSGGHYIPEEHPQVLLDLARPFLAPLRQAGGPQAGAR